MIKLDAARHALETAARELPTDELPALLAALEAARAAAWMRINTPALLEANELPTPVFVDAGEMARRLSLPLFWVQDAARRRKIPSVRVGHYVRFEPAVVIAAVKALDLNTALSDCGQTRGQVL